MGGCCSKNRSERPECVIDYAYLPVNHFQRQNDSVLRASGSRTSSNPQELLTQEDVLEQPTQAILLDQNTHADEQHAENSLRESRMNRSLPAIPVEVMNYADPVMIPDDVVMPTDYSAVDGASGNSQARATTEGTKLMRSAFDFWDSCESFREEMEEMSQMNGRLSKYRPQPIPIIYEEVDEILIYSEQDMPAFLLTKCVYVEGSGCFYQIKNNQVNIIPLNGMDAPDRPASQIPAFFMSGGPVPLPRGGTLPKSMRGKAMWFRRATSTLNINTKPAFYSLF